MKESFALNTWNGKFLLNFRDKWQMIKVVMSGNKIVVITKPEFNQTNVRYLGFTSAELISELIKISNIMIEQENKRLKKVTHSIVHDN